MKRSIAPRVGGRAAILVVATLCALALACGGGGDNKSSTENTSGTQSAITAGATQPTGAVSAAKVKRGGTLSVALEANPQNFDPMTYTDAYSGEVVPNVFEYLYKYDADGKPVPWLAEKVDISPDGTTYTFTLRKNIKFHDGTTMDAEAVKFSIDRIRTNQKSIAYSDAKDITDTTVVDPSTFRLTLKEAFSPFPVYLSGRLGAVVSPTAVKAMGDEKFSQNPVGTGPFKFGEWKADSYVRLEKWDGYWKMGADDKPLPYLQRVEWKIMTEPNGRLTALQTGDVDIAPVRDQDLPIVKKDTNLVFKQQPGFGFSGLLLTIDKPPFDNKALRQALSYAVDREELIRVIYEGNREVANGPIPPVFPWAMDPAYKPYTYDPAKAKAKLAEGGKPTGFEFTAWGTAGNSQVQQWMELLQSQLAKSGIVMKIELADFNGVVVPKARARESNAYVIAFTGGADPDRNIAPRFLAGDSFNYSQYNNPQVTDLILKARRVSGLEERGALYKQVVPILMEDAPYLFTDYRTIRYVGNKKVENWFLGLKATSGYAEYWKN